MLQFICPHNEISEIFFDFSGYFLLMVTDYYSLSKEKRRRRRRRIVLLFSVNYHHIMLNDAVFQIIVFVNRLTINQKKSNLICASYVQNLAVCIMQFISKK
jgi:hypothetical protein